MSQNTNPMPVPAPHFLIPVRAAQGLLVYLKKQPYEDVAGYIDILSKMRQAEFPPKGPSDPGNATGNNGEDTAQTLKAGEGAGKE